MAPGSSAAAQGPGQHGALPTMDAPAPLTVRDLGRLPYARAHELQQACVDERRAGGPDLLLVCEHEPVITLGRGTRGEDWRPDGAAPQLPVVPVERGGEGTYHGPGQVVVYPIVGLRDGARDLHAWLRALEAACLELCADLGLAGAGRREGATGVWIDGARKLVSLGVAARRWVTWHGLALNHTTDLSHFGALRPCGFESSVMTSLEVELGARCPERAAVVAGLTAALERQLLPFREATP